MYPICSLCSAPPASSLHLGPFLYSQSTPVCSESVAGVMVSIVAFQAVDPGSIPGPRTPLFFFFSFFLSFLFSFCHWARPGPVGARWARWQKKEKQPSTPGAPRSEIQPRLLPPGTKQKTKTKNKVLPRLELGFSGSKPDVLTNYTIEPILYTIKATSFQKVVAHRGDRTPDLPLTKRLPCHLAMGADTVITWKLGFDTQIAGLAQYSGRALVS